MTLRWIGDKKFSKPVVVYVTDLYMRQPALMDLWRFRLVFCYVMILIDISF